MGLGWRQMRNSVPSTLPFLGMRSVGVGVRWGLVKGRKRERGRAIFALLGPHVRLQDGRRGLLGAGITVSYIHQQNLDWSHPCPLP
jgi:hypothetical protein